jgi:hypothetical protein
MSLWPTSNLRSSSSSRMSSMSLLRALEPKSAPSIRASFVLVGFSQIEGRTKLCSMCNPQ